MSAREDTRLYTDAHHRDSRSTATDAASGVTSGVALGVGVGASGGLAVGVIADVALGVAVALPFLPFTIQRSPSYLINVAAASLCRGAPGVVVHESMATPGSGGRGYNRYGRGSGVGRGRRVG